jgi:hypothetical protein
MDGVRVVDLGALVEDEEGLEEVVQGIGEVRTHPLYYIHIITFFNH